METGSIHQLLHQGNTFIPSDFIISSKSDSGNQDNHDKLFSNYLSHIEILNKGFSVKESEKLYEEKFSNLGLDKKLVIKNLSLPGRKPTNAFLLKSMSPEAIGELLSYYEHKTYVLGLLSNINSFDQWAVEIGKIKANDIMYMRPASGTVGLSPIEDKLIIGKEINKKIYKFEPIKLHDLNDK